MTRTVAELIDTCWRDEPKEIGRTKSGKWRPTGNRRRKERIRARRRILKALSECVTTAWADPPFRWPNPPQS